MKMDLDLALSLLDRWREENRLVQAGLHAPGATKTYCAIVGRIQRADQDSVTISSVENQRLLLSISDVARVQFEDSRGVPERFPDEREQMREFYEGVLLFQLYSGCRTTIAALKTPDEMAGSVDAP